MGTGRVPATTPGRMVIRPQEWAAWAGITGVAFLGVVGLAQLHDGTPTPPPAPTVTQTRTERPEPSTTNRTPLPVPSSAASGETGESTSTPKHRTTKSEKPSTPPSATAPATSPNTASTWTFEPIPDCNGQQLTLPDCKRIGPEGTIVFHNYGQNFEVLK